MIDYLQGLLGNYSVDFNKNYMNRFVGIRDMSKSIIISFRY